MEQTLLQYGAIGAMLVYMLWKDNRKDEKTHIILSEIKDVLREAVAHERSVSKDCYDKVSTKLCMLDSNVCDLGDKIDNYVRQKNENTNQKST